MTPRILFVDDEVEVLEGIRVRLRQRRQQWKMSFANGPKEALSAIERERFSIVVSDLRMPEMDGATLMERVRAASPSTARVMLSGHGEERLVLKAMMCTHEFLSKPSPPGVLEGTLERICGVQEVIQEPSVLEAVSHIGSFPSEPAVYQKLMLMLSDQRATPEEVSAVLSQDAPLCSQLLRIVNSAYFRLARPILKVEEAVLYLGLETVRQLVLVAEVFQTTDARAKTEWTSTHIRDLREHSLLAASIASTILKGTPQREVGFVAALLHDIGKLVVASELPERTQRIAERSEQTGESLNDSERALFATTHAEIGGYLLALWQLPYPLLEAVANHHQPARLAPKQLDVSLVVHIADFLAHEQRAMAVGVPVARYAQLDLELLEKLGLTSRLEEWRTLAQTHAAT